MLIYFVLAVQQKLVNDLARFPLTVETGAARCCGVCSRADSARTAETRKRQKLDLENKLKETEEAVKMFSKKVGESASISDCSI